MFTCESSDIAKGN